MRERWDGTIGAAGASAEATGRDALVMLTADEDLLQRLFDFTLEHGPTLMDFDGSFGLASDESRACMTGHG